MPDNASATAQRRSFRIGIAAGALPTAIALGITLGMIPISGSEEAPAPAPAPAVAPAAPAPAPAPEEARPVADAPANSPAGAAAVRDFSSEMGTSSGSSGSGLIGATGMLDYLNDGDVPARTPLRTTYPSIPGLPEGVSVVRAEWLAPHRIALFIKSAVMPEQLIQVQVLLARDWFSKPSMRFPTVWALDGLRANDRENGWTLHTNIEQFYADKNVNVVLPVGGKASFYTDWNEPDGGHNYKWESFLLNELPPILQHGYRANGERAIVGLSMGGTAAVNLAEHRPDMFNFVGSFSGYLDTTSSGMYTMIDRALMEENLHAAKMWGRQGSQRWIDNDPKLGIEALRGKTVYVSSGNGRDDFHQPGSPAEHPANQAGMGLEVISRMTSETFVREAKRVPGVNLVEQFRPSGVHDWPYWQLEMTAAWPFIADSLALPREDRGSDCNPIGAISDAWRGRKREWGQCTNNEYDVQGGKAQDFRGGTAFWSAATGAHFQKGRIGARYAELGGSSSFLHFPKTDEIATADGQGRYVEYEHGAIYWTPKTGAQEIPEDFLAEWRKLGAERGDLGYPVGEPRDINGTWIQRFEKGYLVRANLDKAMNTMQVFWLKGYIGKKYGEMGATNSPLGQPRSNEKSIEHGAFQEFEHGKIYWTNHNGAHVVMNGKIFDHWAANGYEKGHFGWPTIDTVTDGENAWHQDFDHGTIRYANGQIIEERK